MQPTDYVLRCFVYNTSPEKNLPLLEEFTGHHHLNGTALILLLVFSFLLLFLFFLLFVFVFVVEERLEGFKFVYFWIYYGLRC